MDIPDELTLVEGEPSSSFPITISQEYSLYCALKYKTSCEVKVVAEFVTPDQKKKCFNGVVIDQIVVEADAIDPSLATCGFKYGGTTKSYSIKLKARVDRINFRETLTRVVKIKQIDTSGGNTLTSDIKTVNVSDIFY